MSTSHSCFQFLQSYSGLFCPSKTLLGQQLSLGLDQSTIILDKLAVVPGQPKEPTQFSSVGRLRPLFHRPSLLWICSHTFWGNHMSQVLNFSLSKRGSGKLHKQLMLAQVCSTERRCSKCSSQVVLKTRMSSKNVMTYLRLAGAKMRFIKHWNVGGPLVTPNGITRNWKCPECVLNAVFSSSGSCIRIWW